MSGRAGRKFLQYLVHRSGDPAVRVLGRFVDPAITHSLPDQFLRRRIHHIDDQRSFLIMRDIIGRRTAAHPCIPVVRSPYTSISIIIGICTYLRTILDYCRSVYQDIRMYTILYKPLFLHFLSDRPEYPVLVQAADIITGPVIEFECLILAEIYSLIIIRAHLEGRAAGTKEDALEERDQ